VSKWSPPFRFSDKNPYFITETKNEHIRQNIISGNTLTRNNLLYIFKLILDINVRKMEFPSLLLLVQQRHWLRTQPSMRRLVTTHLNTATWHTPPGEMQFTGHMNTVSLYFHEKFALLQNGWSISKRNYKLVFQEKGSEFVKIDISKIGNTIFT
jgi:hypothetical protein